MCMSPQALKQRQTEVVRRWDALTAESEAQRKKLTVAHSHFMDIERIFQVSCDSYTAIIFIFILRQILG